MTDLEALRGLSELLGDAEAVARFRSAGLVSVRAGQLELHFAPSVPPSLDAPYADLSPATERNPATSNGPDDDERNALELLLQSSGGDAEGLLDMKRRLEAKRVEAAA